MNQLYLILCLMIGRKELLTYLHRKNDLLRWNFRKMWWIFKTDLLKRFGLHDKQLCTRFKTELKIHFLEYQIFLDFQNWGSLEYAMEYALEMSISGFTLKPLFLPQSMSWLFLRAREKILNLRAIPKPKYYYSSSYSCIWIWSEFCGHVRSKIVRRQCPWTFQQLFSFARFQTTRMRSTTQLISNKTVIK